MPVDRDAPLPVYSWEVVLTDGHRVEFAASTATPDNNGELIFEDQHGNPIRGFGRGFWASYRRLS